MIEKIYFPPPIYRLDKVNTYMISKLHNYLTKSKEISKGVFDEAIFTKIFIKDEIEQSKKELLEVGTNDRRSRIEPLTMGFDRSAYEYSQDPELIELEKQFYKFYIISLKKHLQKIKLKEKNESVKTDEAKQLHPKHDPNLWNNDCFELFKYLYDCYYKTTNRQLTNIWFYLKESKSSKYILKATKDQYIDFIFEKYQKKITNFDKAQTKWEDKECNTINEHRVNFEDSLKLIAENAKNT